MIHAHINKERAVPLWAAIGAPLLGVPLMVGLLSLTTPVDSAPSGAPEAAAATEQVEVRAIDRSTASDTDCTEPSLQRG